MKNNKSIILKDGIAVKYQLGMHTVLSHYPTHNDFIFDCVNHYLSVTKKSNIDPDAISITKADLKAIYTDKLTDSNFVTRLKETIKQLLDLGKLSKRADDVIHVERSGLTDLYQIV